MPTSRDGTLRRDILSAYAASGSRVLSWVIISAWLYRQSEESFAMLALVRGTLGILGYASLGLLPAMIGAFAKPLSTSIAIAAPPDAGGSELNVLNYAPRAKRDDIQPLAQTLYTTGVAIAFVTTFVGIVASFLVMRGATTLYRIPDGLPTDEVRMLLFCMGTGLAIRWLSDPSAALLQAAGHIALDNFLVTLCEILWIAFAYRLHVFINGAVTPLPAIGAGFLLASVSLFAGRGIAARAVAGVSASGTMETNLIRPLLSAGLLITVAQLADYLYSPTDYLLIDHMLSVSDLAAYTPAVQIDGGLMLLVTALAAVLLPRAALAHAAGHHQMLRKYYRGTLASAAVLLLASATIYFASPLIFRLWFADRMPATQAILPLVLLNTIIGGSGAVGRAILIGMGKTKPFAISVLIAGVTNVICSYVFVRYGGMGLNGIVLGTVVAVVARCGVWMPWYIMRQLREFTNR